MYEMHCKVTCPFQHHSILGGSLMPTPTHTGRYNVLDMSGNMVMVKLLLDIIIQTNWGVTLTLFTKLLLFAVNFHFFTII